MAAWPRAHSFSVLSEEFMKSLLGLWTAGISLSVAAVAFGCGGSSTTPATTTTTPTTTTSSFTTVYTTVLETNGCTSHHAGASPAGGLDMSTQPKAYADLVNVPAVTPAGETPACTGDRVVPNEPSASLLYLKVSESSPPCGARMPLGGTPLSAAEQTLIKDWITAGAKND